MGIGVVAHGVALLHHAADQVRASFQIVAHQEKGGGHLVLLQGVQNGSGTAVFIAGIEGEVKDFLLGVLPVQGIELGQVCFIGVANGRGTLLLEGKAPVGDFGRSQQGRAFRAGKRGPQAHQKRGC